MAVPYSITKNVSKINNKTYFYATPQLYGTKTTKEIGKIIAQKTTVTIADVYAVLYALSEAITDVLQSGYQASLDGIGKMSVGLKSTNALSKEDFTASNIVGAKVRMRPDAELKTIYDGMEFEFVPSRKDQEIAKAAAKAGMTITAKAITGDVD